MASILTSDARFANRLRYRREVDERVWTWVGLAICAVVVAVEFLKKKQTGRRFLGILNTGGAVAARQFLQSRVPSAIRLLPNKVNEQRTRMAALVILGDVEQIQTELGGHRDENLIHTARVHVVGLLGLAVRAPDPSPYVDHLESLASRVAMGGPEHPLALETRRAADLGAALAGRPLGPVLTAAILSDAKRSERLVGLVQRQALAVALERGGDAAKANEIFALVRAQASTFVSTGRAPATR
jgi:hypothetical protein